MGICCCINKEDKEDKEDVDYINIEPSFKILSISEAYTILKEGSIMCRLCKEKICHAYISIICCNYCRLIIGHEECYYKNKIKICPLHV
jgi:hypothetical protein